MSADGLLREFHVVSPCREAVTVIHILEDRRDVQDLFVIGNKSDEKPFPGHFKIKGM